MNKLINLLLCLWASYASASWEFQDGANTPKWIGAPKSVQLEAFKGLDTLDKDVLKTYPALKPVLYFRKTFSFEEPVASAKLYLSAKGLFQGFLTETRYSLEDGNVFPILTPGWTDYNKRIQYYVFDVASILNHNVNNTLGIVVGSGWYSGYIGDKYGVYGNDQSALVQLKIVFANGTEAAVLSDETWKVTTGPLVYSDLTQGELYYENRDLVNWISYDYDDSKWSNVLTKPVDESVEMNQDVLPIQMRTLEFPSNIWQVDNKTWVYDFGQVMTGQIVLSIFHHTARIQVRYAEGIYPNGSIYTENHGSGLRTDTYVLNDPKDGTNQIYLRPIFTYQSFRYVEISGLNESLGYQVRALPFAQQQYLSKFAMSNDINRLLENLSNSFMNNFLNVQTNNPSSNERLGWLEPAGLFSETAMRSSKGDSDGYAFYKKWLRDIRDAQASSGAFSDTSPSLSEIGDASPGSGFAPILITYNLYRFFKDLGAVEENYDSNKKWIDYVVASNPNFLFINNVGRNQGDYANVNADTPKEIISTAYFAYGAYLMSYLAKALNKTDDQKYYVDLHRKVSEAFVKTYVNGIDGKIMGDTQTGYVVGLAFKILPDELIPKAVQNLVENIKAHDYHLTTGYVGTAFLLPVLADYGHVDIAYKLLMQDTFPSWGYMINNNATGIWERWDSWTEEGGFQGSSLNSLALGSVGSFLYGYLAGINTDDEKVGFEKVIIKPYIAGNMTGCSGTSWSNYGEIVSKWIIYNDTFSIEVTIPEKTTGKLILPFVNPVFEKEFTSGTHEFNITLQNV